MHLKPWFQCLFSLILSLPLCIIPFSDAFAEYFLVYGQTPSMADAGCGCSAAHHHRHRRHGRSCHVRRPCTSSVSMRYNCPSVRHACGCGPEVTPIGCSGDCGGGWYEGCMGFGGCDGWTPDGWRYPYPPSYDVYYDASDPNDYPAEEEYFETIYNPDLATGDDNAMCNPDMLINY